MSKKETLLELFKEAARMKATVELTKMIGVMRHLLEEDFIYFLIVLAAMNPDIPMPKRLYEEMTAKGFTPKNRQMSDEEELEGASELTKDILEKILAGTKQ